LLAGRWNSRNREAGFHAALAVAALLTTGGALALLAGPYLTGLDPTRHVYPATVWVLVLWTAIHLGVGLIMQLYCIARRYAGLMSAAHDIDIRNVALYWHFLMLTVAVTVAVIAGFPKVA